jgi:hypothetical protein
MAFMNEYARKILISIRSLSFYPELMTRVKYMTIDVAFMFLGPIFEVVSDKVPEMKKEIEDWEDGRKFAIGVLPKGPAITLEKKGSRIWYLGKGFHSPEISMLFKNLDAALPVFLGMKGSFQAFAENGVIVDGNLAHTMEVNRAVNIVNSYLFPGFVLKKILKRPPRMDLAQYITKARVYAGIVPAFIKHVR